MEIPRDQPPISEVHSKSKAGFLILLFIILAVIGIGSYFLIMNNSSQSDNSECQTHFKMAYIYLYEASSHSEINLNRLKNAKSLHQDVFNIAGREKITLDITYQVFSIEITELNRERFINSEKNDQGFYLNFQEVIKTFYQENPDDFDFISIFTNFPLDDTGSSSDYHMSVQNKIQGMGQMTFDDSSNFGSSGKLLGWNYIGNLNQIYSQEALEEFSEEQINCMTAIGGLVHETAHQWVAYIGSPEGGESKLILQNKFANHWISGLNIGYDPVGGGRWKNNNDGTFTLLEPEEFCASRDSLVKDRYGIAKFSDLSLYLLGAIDSREVEPILWIDYEGPLSPGETINSESKYISIKEIIKEEGKRICLI